MVLSRPHEKQLIKRLRLVGFLLLAFSISFLGYSFFTDEPSPLEGELSLEEAGEVPAPGPKFYLIGGGVFCVTGLATLLFAANRIKQI